MSKARPWYSDPTKIVPLALGVSASIIGFFVKDALTQERVRRVEQDVQQVETVNEQQTDDLQQSYTQQQIIQKDIEYIKQQNALILDAIKQRR